MNRKSPIDLVYGTDCYAGGDLTLLVLDRRGTEEVLKAVHATTWAQATRALTNLDEDERAPDDLFDAAAEWEFGVLYHAAVAAESAAAEIVGKLPRPVLDLLGERHVTFDFGQDCNRCYLRSDESAVLLSEQLRRHLRREVRLVRNDQLVESHRRAEGWSER